MLRRIPRNVPALFIIVAALAAGALRASEIQPGDVLKPGELEPVERRREPDIAPASGEAELALTRMKLPHGLVATLWAAEPMLANPVAFNLDEHGRVFVAETYRYRTSVLDIRDYMWMLEDELANRNQDDFLATLRRWFGEDGLAELSKESEILRLLEDTDGDGVADKSSIYAGDFRSPIDGIASGVLIRRNEVWFTNIPALWRFTGHDRAETREVLHRGYGIRFNYTGHDFHGLVFAPDGRIYFSIGDRGASVTTKEGTEIHVPDTGSVFRCWPDGTGLELFATGMRNPQSLAFNEYGDLFTGDNDSDQDDQERLVHVVEGGDSGWRIGYQFAPREYAGPWNAEKLWWPRHEGQPAYLLPPICNIEDGPSGIAYYPGTGLTPEYAGHLFITHFKGAITHSGIYAYKLEQAGASYAIETAKPFLTGALPTDVRFGPEGKLYYSDWAEGWPKSRRGRIYTIFDPERLDDPLVVETRALLSGDWAQRDPAGLAQLLAHPDWRVRLEAQYTLAERGAESISVFAGVLDRRDAPHAELARRHAVWGLGQLARKHAAARTVLRPLVADADAEIRAQAVKTLGDLRDTEVADAFIAALHDDSPRVRFFAGIALGKLRHAAATPALLEAVRANADRDAYLRHGLVMGLAGCATPEELVATITDASPAVRRAAVLTLRRLQHPGIAVFLTDADPLIAREAAIAINDAPVPAARRQLALFVTRPVDDEPLMLRALNAAFRLGGADQANALAAFAARDDATETLRLEALTLLRLWPEPPARDRIVGVYRPLDTSSRDEGAAADALAAHADSLLDGSAPEAVQVAAITTGRALDLDIGPLLQDVVADAARPGSIRATALKALADLEDPNIDASVQVALQSDAPELRLAALPIATQLHPETAVPTLAALLEIGTAAEQRAAFDALATADDPRADAILLQQLERLTTGGIAPSAQLELLEAAAQRSDPRVQEALAKYETALTREEDPLAPYRVALEGGDVRRGRHLFFRHPVIACTRCHRTDDSPGSEAGPNLAGIGARRSREYILRSILKPSAEIADGFAIATVTKTDGEAIVGIIAAQDETTVHLTVGEETTALPRSEIRSIALAPSAMPEIAALVLSKAEIRDLVEFVSSLKEPARPRETQPIRALLSQPEL